MKSHRAAIRILPFFLVSIICIALLAPAPASAQGGSIDISGTISPAKVNEKDPVHISLTVTNNMAMDIDGYDVQFFIYKESMGTYADGTKPLTIMNGGSTPISFDWTAKSAGEYTVIIIVVDGFGTQVGVPYEMPQKVIVKKAVNPDEGFLNMKIAGIPVIFLLVIVIFLVAVIAVVAVKMRNKKKKGPEITGEGVEVQGRVAWGKMPENYYKERRERLAKLRPVGLTRDGRTILGNSRIGEVGAITEVEHGSDMGQSKICQKCGFEMTAESKTCLKCEATSNIRETKTLMKNPFFQGHNLDFAEVIIRQADAALESENYTEASVFALDARSKVDDYKRKVDAERKATEDPSKSEGKGGQAAAGSQTTGPGGKPALVPPSSCIGCGMGMQSDWTKCPVCGMSVEDMLKPQEEKPHHTEDTTQVIVPASQSYICSTCGNEKENETAQCVHCNTGRAVSNAERKVKELRLTLATIQLSGEDQLEVNEAFDLFADAKGAFTDKDYTTCVGLAGETIELVEELLVRFSPRTAPAPAPVTPKPQAPPTAAQPPKPAAPLVQPVAPQAVSMALADNKCPKCGMSVKPTWEICPQCDTQLRAPTPATAVQKTCPTCSKPIKDRWTICPFCEGPLK